MSFVETFNQVLEDKKDLRVAIEALCDVIESKEKDRYNFRSESYDDLPKVFMVS